jgi:hypothetical protein
LLDVHKAYLETDDSQFGLTEQFVAQMDSVEVVARYLYENILNPESQNVILLNWKLL